MNKIAKWLALLTFAFVLSACGSTSSAPTPTEEDRGQAPTAETTTALVLPTETPEIADECTACHSDKQRLIDTAKPEEEVVEESEGAG